MLSGASCSRNALKRSATPFSSPSCAKILHGRPKCERCLATRAVSWDVSSQQPFRSSTPQRSFFPRQTQSQLFAVSPDSTIAMSAQNSHTARLKLKLAECAEEGLAFGAIRLCADMKRANIAPDTAVYNWLIHACAKQGLASECLAFLEDMELSNVKRTIETYNYVIYAQRWSNTFILEDILDRMERDNIRLNTHTFHHIILRYAEAQNLEMCLQCFREMGEKNISPSLASTQAVITLASQIGHARLALDIAHAFEASSVRKLETQDWVQILAASTGCLFEQGVVIAWKNVVEVHHVSPDEGMCLEVLHASGRHGLTNLALDVIQCLKNLQVPLQEHHLVPVLEAFCKNKMLKDAFTIINLMRSSDILLNAESALPILGCIRHDVEEVDNAWGVLEKMHQDGDPIDVLSVNVIVQASTELQDLQRAIGVYKACPSLGVKPSIETFNHILSGCISMSHKELGDKILEELRQQGLSPDADTFERIIVLCLTQTTYEDAFFYLEEMKGLGYRPPLSVYEALIRKCVVSGDVRWKIAMDELHDCGYVAPPQLQNFVASGGKISGRIKWDNHHSETSSGNHEADEAIGLDTEDKSEAVRK